MNAARLLVVAAVLPFCLAQGARAGGLSMIGVSDSGIAIHLDGGVSGEVRIVEIEPYDKLDPLRGLASSRPDCMAIDLSHEGYLRMTFPDPAPAGFDPQIVFPAYPVNADFVGRFSMRARVSGTQGGADMPFRIFGLPAFVDVALPADGEWHIVRADMAAADWSGVRTLRIDPADAQVHAANAAAVLDIDWVAVTYRDDFDGGRNRTGLDVFIDLGVPEASWAGAAQPTVMLPRFDGLRDRLYSKYVLLDGGSTNQIGAARHVTDLSGLSYRRDSVQGWSALNTANGMMPPVVSDGVLAAQYAAPSGTWDPAILPGGTQRANLDVAREFAMKYRITGYSGSQPTVPWALYGYIEGASGTARQEDVLVPDGQWRVYRARLDQSVGTLPWYGSTRIRIDVPNGLAGTYPAAHFVGGALELDWVAVTDDPLFTPSRPLCAGGRLWTFTDDRTGPLLAGGGFKGVDGNYYEDKADLGCQLNKMNFLQRNAINLSLNPATAWPVDEFEVGINTTYVNNQMKAPIKYFSDRGIATVITSLNSIQGYWLDEGMPSQRFNPLRNHLSVTNPPNSFSVAHNVMDPVGLAYYRGTLEYLGDFFSNPSGDNGQIFRYTIGNELDAHYSWYNLGEIELERVVDIYLVSCRIADLALRSRHPDYRIYLSFTHYWNRAAPQGALRAGKPKEFLEMFAAKARAEGDFPWALCIHPYPVNLRKQEFWNDTAPTDDFDTQYITFKNLQVIRRYLQQEHMLHHGQVRPVNLGEQGFDVVIDGDPLKEAVQAAALAYSYKITEQVPDIEAYLYHRQIDHPDENKLLFGLWADDPDTPGQQPFRKRPSWFVMRDYGTTNETATFDPYLAYLPISDWSEINLADIKLWYEFNGPNPDLYTRNLPAYAVSNGVFAATVAHGDPQIINDNVNTYGDGQETCLLRIKTGTAGDWQLFWKRAGDAAFSSARVATFPVAASADFAIYQVDLSTHADWAGKNIVAWRLDPAGSTTPYAFELDYMVFGPAGDFDGDGIPDGEEGLDDLDGDGWPNLADLDSNGNGWPDARLKRLGFNPHSPDSNGDGIPDDWKILHGYDPYDTADAGWDADGDGFDTRAEYIAGTDPADGLDYFRIAGLDGGTNVLAEGKAGRTYTLWRSTNLVSGAWTAAQVLGPLAADMPVALTDTNVSGSAVYRLVVE